MPPTALIVGSTGIAGSAVARRLLSKGWTVYGVSRGGGAAPAGGCEGLSSIAVDLTDASLVATALAHVDPTHVFLTVWSRQPTEAENITVNGGMLRNVLAALPRNGALVHVGLVTGLKHYLGPFESYTSGAAGALVTPLREDMPRLPLENFYYAQEDVVYEACAARGVGWSVHRPHTIIGFALGNAMNMGVTLACYAALCVETGRPFTFPGSAVQWNCLTDMTDADVLAEQVEWAAATPAARNQAYNVTNGDVFRWSWMWGQVAAYFGLTPAPMPPTRQPLEAQMAGDAPAWRALAARHGLVEADLGRLVSPWHTDLDLGRPCEVVTDVCKSREASFTAFKCTRSALLALFDTLRAARVIPPGASPAARS